MLRDYVFNLVFRHLILSKLLTHPRHNLLHKCRSQVNHINRLFNRYRGHYFTLVWLMTSTVKLSIGLPSCCRFNPFSSLWFRNKIRVEYFRKPHIIALSGFFHCFLLLVRDSLHCFIKSNFLKEIIVIVYCKILADVWQQVEVIGRIVHWVQVLCDRASLTFFEFRINIVCLI